MASNDTQARNCSVNTVLQPNPDISGVGALVGFLSTAYITFIFCIAQHYINVKRSVPEETPYYDRLAFALGGAIQSFSDQQLVAGISILVGGYSQLEWDISVYHWDTVVNLAWFSTMTHLITLVSLRDQICSNKALRMLRVITMGILNILLVCAIGPNGYTTTPTSELSDGFPARCLFYSGLVWVDPDSLYPLKSYNWIYITFTICILVFGYVSRVALLFEITLSHSILRIPEGQPWRLIETALARLQATTPPRGLLRFLCRTMYKLFRALYAVLLTGNNMYRSTLWEFTWLFIAIAWGTIRVIIWRYYGVNGFDGLGGSIPDTLNDVIFQETRWGFGQVVAVLLLILPAISFLELYFVDEKDIPKCTAANPGLVQNLHRRNSNASINLMPEKKRLQEEPWYTKMKYLWYLLSVTIGAILCFIYPAMGSFILLDTSSVGYPNYAPPLSFITSYIVWFSFNFGLLLIPTLIFIDKDIQKAWRLSYIGKHFRSPLILSIAWVFVLLVLTGTSVLGFVLVYSGYIPF